MKVKATFDKKWSDGDIIMTDPMYGNYYVVDNNGDLNSDIVLKSDFIEGIVFRKVGHVMTDTNSFQLETGITEAKLLGYEFVD